MKPTYEQLSQELQEKREEMKTLMAHVERLRDFIEVWYEAEGCIFNGAADRILEETPQQSLNRIRAKIIEQCIQVCDREEEEAPYDIHGAGRCSESLKDMLSKYKDQSDED